MKIKLIKWRQCSVWSWNIDSEVCTICRQSFDQCCSDCKFGGDDCPPVFGECNHPYHIHCILKWLKAQPQDQEQCMYDTV